MDGLTTSSFFGDLWDEAKGVFKTVVDFEIFKAQMDLAQDSLRFQAELESIQAPVGSTSWAAPSLDIPWTMVLLVGGGVALVIWAARKL